MNPVVGCHHLPAGPQQHTRVYHEPGGRLPVLAARPAVTFPAVRHHHPYGGTNLLCLVTEAHRCEKLAQGFCAVCPAENRTHDLCITSPTLYHSTTMPPIVPTDCIKNCFLSRCKCKQNLHDKLAYAVSVTWLRIEKVRCEGKVQHVVAVNK